MKNKQTGPITIAGKGASSKNAIKHGGTSPKLINTEEQERYKTLVEGLKNEYRSSNPLVELQINRIARLYIQLERIQDVTDATFKKSRTRLNTTENLIAAFNQKNIQLETIAANLFDFNGQIKNEIIKAIALELIHAEDINHIQSEEEFIKDLPFLNDYVIRRANLSQVSIEEFLISEAQGLSDTYGNYCEMAAEHFEFWQKNHPVPEHEEISEKIKLNLLKAFALEYRKILRDVLVGPEDNLSIKETIQIEEEAMLPNPQEMDRLMRYQTTLQRQLSSAIGELLEINKVGAPL